MRFLSCPVSPSWSGGLLRVTAESERLEDIGLRSSDGAASGVKVAIARFGMGCAFLCGTMKKKKLASWLTCVLVGLSFVRTSVLLFESWAEVRDERAADAELVTLCRSGVARSSPKLRMACLRAKADAASPIVLKAVARAVSTCFNEFSQSVATPWGLATVAMFVLSSLMLPAIPWLRVLGHSVHVEDEDDVETDSQHVIVLTGGGGGVSEGGLRRVQRALHGPVGGWS